ncbi:MAG: hypothetical protein QOH25_343 [Acidobacteriota bacterium]|jgi:hypothetical protein|nr:hypothetical protein [Acidobacteriota bacterium]
MKNYAHMIRYSISGLALLSALFVSGAQLSVSAQEASKESAPGQVKIRGPRDPFVPYVPPTRKKKTVNGASPVSVPSIQERIDKYKAQKREAMNKLQPAPKPTTALLLSEMQVTGIFRTPRGYAAMVEATPIKLSYVIYPGEMFYDGQLVAIEEDRLVFRHETRWTDGRVEKAVENKPLRQPNAVADSLTATKAATDNGNGAAATTTPAIGDEKAPTPEKQ